MTAIGSVGLLLTVVLSFVSCAVLGASLLEAQKVYACGPKLGCKEYSPLPLPAALNGSWSGRLHTGSQRSSHCYSESDWRKAATEECGAEPTLYRVGVHCGEQRHKFVEVVFVCDRPKKRLSPDPWTVEPEREERYFMRRNEILVELAKVTRLWHTVTNGETDKKMIKSGNDIELSFIAAGWSLFNELQTNLDDLYPALDILNTEHHTYVSQDTVLQNAQKLIYKSNPGRGRRPRDLIFVVLGRLMYGDHNITNQDAFDKDYYVGGKELNQPLDSAAAFPELKPRITRLFVENLQKHSLGFAPENLGFLGERCAERQLRKMYEEVFTVGHFDRKYLTNTQRV